MCPLLCARRAFILLSEYVVTCVSSLVCLSRFHSAAGIHTCHTLSCRYLNTSPAPLRALSPPSPLSDAPSPKAKKSKHSQAREKRVPRALENEILSPDQHGAGAMNDRGQSPELDMKAVYRAAGPAGVWTHLVLTMPALTIKR